MPSEELGPASVHVKSKGFGVSVISENSLVTDSMPFSADSTYIASSFATEAAPSTTADAANADAAADASAVVVANVSANAVAVVVAVDSTNGLESSTSTSSSEGSIPLGPRVYPPSKPHQGSGRQAESLVKLKQELRNGVDR